MSSVFTMESEKEFAKPTILSPSKLLTIFVLKDGDKFSAKCVELDLITEMDTPQAALTDLLEIIKEYAQDYYDRFSLFSKSPNRAHHRPYVEQILECKSDWELLERCEIKYASLQL